MRSYLENGSAKQGERNK